MNINDEKWFDRNFLDNMTREEASSAIEQAVYEACHLFERLEGANKVRGNGHHMMQTIAAEAGKLMRERWIIKTPNVEDNRPEAVLSPKGPS